MMPPHPRVSPRSPRRESNRRGRVTPETRGTLALVAPLSAKCPAEGGLDGSIVQGAAFATRGHRTRHAQRRRNTHLRRSMRLNPSRSHFHMEPSDSDSDGASANSPRSHRRRAPRSRNPQAPPPDAHTSHSSPYMGPHDSATDGASVNSPRSRRRRAPRSRSHQAPPPSMPPSAHSQVSTAPTPPDQAVTEPTNFPSEFRPS